ncbi:MAG TPA: glutamate formimidoyltransferase [Thermoanaerobaculia bacterium]
MIEAVPNISEGRDRDTIDAIASAIRKTRHVHLLNVSSDVDHNRSVFTYISENAEAIQKATLALYRIAVDQIDLQHHRGEHPRAGAVDVCPFVPLRGTEMLQCMALAERVAAEVAERFKLPVYLYEYAAKADYRRELPAIRSGGFENFPEKIKDPRWQPDYGPATVHPTAGVTIIGARVPLIAFNVQLGTDRIDIAEKIARAVRGVSGGLRFVRALPIRLKHRGAVQVSMNLLDYRKTPIHRAFSIVRDEAARWGVDIVSTEIVGLIPADALYAFAEWHLKIENFQPGLVLERRINEVLKETREKKK